MKHFLWIFSMGVLVMSACTIDDEDRCPGGYEWDNALKACLEKEEKEDAGCVVGEDVGFLQPCESDADCADFAAKDCIDDPRDPGSGICNIVNCVPDDCVCDFECCDCESLAVNPFPAGPVCASPESTATLAGLGCICE